MKLVRTKAQILSSCALVAEGISPQKEQLMPCTMRRFSKLSVRKQSAVTCAAPRAAAPAQCQAAFRRMSWMPCAFAPQKKQQIRVYQKAQGRCCSGYAADALSFAQKPPMI